MKTPWVIVWFLVVLVLFIFIKRKFRLHRYGLIGLGFLAIILWVGGGTLINSNTIPPETQEKIDEITAVYGDTYIKTKGSDIYIKINDEWLNLSDINVVGSVLTDDLSIEYEGKEIYLGHSGVVNVIKTLEALGLID